MAAKSSKRAFDAARANLWMFDPDKLTLVEDPQDPLYDDRVKLPLDEALVRNIMSQGILEPVVIVKREGNPTVVAGRQRVRAALEANKRLKSNGSMPVRVPCVLRRDDDRACLGVMVSENELRQDDSPEQKAAKVQRLLGMGYTEDELAVLFGRSTQTIRNWLQLAESPPEIRKAVERGEITPTVARKVRNLPKTEQQKAIAKAKIGAKKKPTTRAVETAVRQTQPARPRMRNRVEIEHRLAEKNLPEDYSLALKWVLRVD